MRSRKRIGAIAAVAVIAGLISLAACGGQNSASAEPPEIVPAVGTDPKAGWVQVWPQDDDSPVRFFRTYKRCDGHNLVYASNDPRGGIGGVDEDSDQCR